MPRRPKDVVFVGAGGVVRAAHLPAYRDAGFVVRGFFDVDARAAARSARELGGGDVYASLDEAAAQRDVVFDVAVPASEIAGVLRALPDRSIALVQKPFGRTLAEARRLADLCRAKRLVAAVNFQLRFAPNVLALRAALERGALGRLVDLEMRTSTFTPWDRWTFLAGIPRMEVLYHSIHTLDLFRALAGEPLGVRCALDRDPRFPDHADTRVAIHLALPGGARATVRTLHSRECGREGAMSELHVEGEHGFARLGMGVNLDYPRGEPDTLAFCARGGAWREAELEGSWFPAAFRGTMANLQRFASGEDRVLETRVDDALSTMALVEACYADARRPATRVPPIRSKR